jgi:predicted GNAT family acetyltransferase
MFLDVAGTFLAEREAEHNLLLGIAGHLRHSSSPYGDEAPYFAVVEEASRVVAASLRTPPWNLVLSEVDDATAVPLLARDAHAAFGELPGVLGPKQAAGDFVGVWEELTGTTARVELEERIYRARAARSPEGVPGHARSFEENDRDVVLTWLRAFQDEALPSGSPRAADDWIDRRLDESGSGIVLWDDDGPVSLAGFGNPTPTGVRIGPVYTPPAARRRGYASALVAAITEERLRSGRQFCFLFTDLANPTSNSIYQTVGYEPVSDVDQWAFES